MTERRANAIAATLIVVAGLAAYSGSFHGVFLFDDPTSIAQNPTIRHLWPPWDVLATPRTNVTVQSRPVLNLSFALNYAFGGTEVWGYHAANLLIHVLAGLALYGIVRRTLARNGTLMGCSVGLIWTVHPLQTEAVTYIVQRAESLMGLFYLLTLYFFIRASRRSPLNANDGAAISAPVPGTGSKSGDESPGRRLFELLSVFACLLGMGTKEVMASAPLMVLLYDRTFVAGSFKGALARRPGYYAALASTWILLGYLVARGGGNRGGSIGFGVDVPWWTYGLTQFEAIGRYLLLSFWPSPLVFEYGAFTVKRASQVLPWAAVVLPLLLGTAWAVWRRPVWGFLGCWFFVILSPTSLVPGTSQMIVEHRMYLSLAAVVTVAVVGGHAFAGRRFCGAMVVAAIVLGALTCRRNVLYRSAFDLWADTLDKRPANQLAHYMLAEELLKAGRNAEALPEYESAVRLDPTFFVAQERLGDLLVQLGRKSEAAGCYEAALKTRPDFADANDNYGILLADEGRTGDAIAHMSRAIESQPDYEEAHYNLANVYSSIGRKAEAVAEFETALKLKPDQSAVHFNLANTLCDLGRNGEAIAQYAAALRLKPDYPAAEYNWGNCLIALRRREEAMVHYEAALRLKPDYADAEVNLGSVCFELGRLADAEAHYERALRLNPRMEDARANLARVRAAEGR